MQGRKIFVSPVEFQLTKSDRYFFYVPVTAFSVQKWLMLKKMAALGRRERRAEDFELQSLPRIELQAEEHC